MGAILAELAARTRFSVKLTLSEADALADAAGQFRGSRELNSALRRVREAADRKRRAAMRMAK